MRKDKGFDGCCLYIPPASDGEPLPDFVKSGYYDPAGLADLIRDNVDDKKAILFIAHMIGDFEGVDVEIEDE